LLPATLTSSDFPLNCPEATKVNVTFPSEKLLRWEHERDTGMENLL
jgi:hypothetical protein